LSPPPSYLADSGDARLPDGQIASLYQKSRQALPLKIFYFRFSEIHGLSPSVPHSPRGALRDRHGRWERDAMDALVRLDVAGDADGETVWSWPPDAEVKLRETSVSFDDGGYQSPDTGESAA
jgi:hypothetical protein